MARRWGPVGCALAGLALGLVSWALIFDAVAAVGTYVGWWSP